MLQDVEKPISGIIPLRLYGILSSMECRVLHVELGETIFLYSVFYPNTKL